MGRRKPPARSDDWLFPKAAIQTESEEPSSLLDVVDSLLNKGVVVNGDVVLGVAKVDLIYAKLSVLLAALDRIMNTHVPRKRTRGRSRKR
jgi:hypothetical protein